MGGGRGYLGSFSVCFEATTKKVVNFFLGGKVHPSRQNPGYAYAYSQVYD